MRRCGRSGLFVLAFVAALAVGLWAAESGLYSRKLAVSGALGHNITLDHLMKHYLLARFTMWHALAMVMALVPLQAFWDICDEMRQNRQELLSMTYVTPLETVKGKWMVYVMELMIIASILFPLCICQYFVAGNLLGCASLLVLTLTAINTTAIAMVLPTVREREGVARTIFLFGAIAGIAIISINSFIVAGREALVSVLITNLVLAIIVNAACMYAVAHTLGRDGLLDHNGKRRMAAPPTASQTASPEPPSGAGKQPVPAP